jgi:hypothetical protein
MSSAFTDKLLAGASCVCAIIGFVLILPGMLLLGLADLFIEEARSRALDRELGGDE